MHPLSQAGESALLQLNKAPCTKMINGHPRLIDQPASTNQQGTSRVVYAWKTLKIQNKIVHLPRWESTGIPNPTFAPSLLLAECHRQSPNQRRRSQRGSAPGVKREVHVRPVGHGYAHGGEGELLIWSRESSKRWQVCGTEEGLVLQDLAPQL